MLRNWKPLLSITKNKEMEDRFFEILKMFKKGNDTFAKMLERKYPDKVTQSYSVDWKDIKDLREPFMLAENVLSTPTFDREDISFDVLFVNNAYLDIHKHSDCKERVQVIEGECKFFTNNVYLYIKDITIPPGQLHGFWGKKGTVLKVTFQQ